MRIHDSTYFILIGVRNSVGIISNTRYQQNFIFSTYLPLEIIIIMMYLLFEYKLVTIRYN